MMRWQALAAKPLEINFFQAVAVLAHLDRRLSINRRSPTGRGVSPSWIVVASILSTSGTLLFAWAYARGEASYLAVTEYSAFIWASTLGWLVFNERVSLYTLGGALLIVGGCLIAARRKPADRRKSTSPPSRPAEHVYGEREHADVECEGGKAMHP